MRIERPDYIEKLVRKKENGMIKVITGIRRSGKSYLLKELYRNYLIDNGVAEEQIIILDLDEIGNAKYRNPFEMDIFIKTRMTDPSKMYYIFIDEIQKASAVANPYVDDRDEKITFVDTILGLQKQKNADIYVTGSNSKMLSSDVLTMFRGRGDEIRVRPLSYSEFRSAYTGDIRHAWRDYWTYGGMPYVMSLNEHKDKSDYLRELFTKIYLQDILERNNIKNDSLILEDLLDCLSSSVGSLRNPTKLSNTFASEKNVKISNYTIDKYLGYFEDSFLLEKIHRYDVKGRKYISTPMKYYFEDVGLRNARLIFRQMEENHIMENIIYNELALRGYNIDIGVVELNGRDSNGKSCRKQLEVDFVANNGSNRYYIQSAFNMDDMNKQKQEIASLLNITDSFTKIIVQKDDIIPWRDDNGILHLNIEQFLLDRNLLS